MSAENDNSHDPLGEWLRLQQDFQARLADETLRYLRRLQGAIGPVVPGTVLLPEKGSDLGARAPPGGAFEIALDVHNYQRVHAVAAPSLDPLVSPSGTTWYPEADFSPGFSLVPPDESVKFTVRVSVPAGLPPATYVGALSFRGLRQTAFRLSVEVAAVNTTASATTATPTVRRKKTKPRKAKKK